ncbi:type II toxin-antitoxin system YafQ family toxin [Azotobacter salinestris]|uniref:type II toxin-antitoxin system YafQ family toxin n=1 Tax=Azotobacter salinestris TaxID=69964 RepID=UPI0012669773|nr:type II toxin-antitoxin system YafQ family toxin [Azotobacter salinestris]
MRTIKQTGQFKRDLKREVKGPLEQDLLPVIEVLAKDRPLEPKHRDHALSGNWADHRDCHIKPDLVLLYRKPGDETLQLVRLGSHSELGL